MVTLVPWYTDLRRKMVVDPILNDSRNTGMPETRLGWPVDWIFNMAIGGGQADFDLPIENLEPDDRALLYAFFNQKGHVEELVHAFGLLWPNTSSMEGTTVIDVGCGPFTAGLALANVIGTQARYRYFGVDRAASMCRLGERLAQEARTVGGLHVESTFHFLQSLADIGQASPRFTPTVIVLSYLLASESLDVKSLIADVLEVCNKTCFGSTSVLYTNSARLGARQKYPELEACLAAADFKTVVEDSEVLNAGPKQRSIHYALFHRPARSQVPMTVFL